PISAAPAHHAARCGSRGRPHRQSGWTRCRPAARDAGCGTTGWFSGHRFSSTGSLIGGRSRGCCGMCALLLLLQREAAAHHIEHGGEQQTEEGHTDHAVEHGGTQRLAHLEARTLCDRQRQYAEDEGKRGHQDRTQTRTGGSDGGVEAAHAIALLVLPCELHDKDGVLRSQCDQYHETHLREDVVVHAAQVHTHDGGQQTHRHDQDHRQRQREGFVLRREYQEDEHHGEQEDQHTGVPCQFFLVGDVGPLEGHALRQHFCSELLHGSECLHRGVTRCGLATHVGGREQVVAQHTRRAGVFLQVDDGGQRHHLATARTHLQVEHVTAVITEAGIRLRDHLVGTAEQVQVVHVERTEVDVHRVEDVNRVHAEQLGAVAVEVTEQTRCAGVELVEHAGDFRNACSSLHQGVGRVFQRLVVAAVLILDHHAETTTVTHALHGRRRDDDDAGTLHDAQCAHQLAAKGYCRLPCFGAFDRIRQTHEQRTGVRFLRGAGGVVAGESHHFGDARHFAGDVHCFAHHGIS